MKNIVIIHTAFIGDIVLSTPMIKRLKEKYPESRIVYLTTPLGKEILENNPFLDEIMVFDKRGKDRGFKGFLRICKNVRDCRFDLAVIPHRYIRSSLIAFLGRVKVRNGYRNSEGRLFLNRTVEYLRGVHEVERLLRLAEIA